MRIVAVVVLYNIVVEDSPTIQSLLTEIQLAPSLLNQIQVILLDNSSSPLPSSSIPSGFEYRHSEVNIGVSGAYNSALQHAKALTIPWMLLLDQDTKLPTGYLRRMLKYVDCVDSDASVATIVPLAGSEGTLVSPRYVGFTLRSSQVPKGISGVIRKEAFSINSGALMRVSALDSIGGYSHLFWLDFSDQYVFHLLYRAGYVMYFASDLKIEHSIANSDYDRNMSAARYINFLAAENLFTRTFHGMAANAVHNIILIARAARQFRRYRNKEFARLTIGSLKQRMLLSSDAAIELWTRHLGQRRIPNSDVAQESGYAGA